ncbi:MAG: amidase [Burkholderiaceae bacterium]|nr:amidase [Burkholderiaceae bacterium]
MEDPPLHYLSISAAAKRLQSGELTSTELTRACLDRITALDARLHAFITVTAEQALADAKLVDAEIAAGRGRGPMHGIPIAYKDIILTAGVRTTAHSKLLRDWVPDTDAHVVRRLKDAGAVSLGKLACWEFAYGNPGPEVAFPPARNPWNTDYSPGGSSSGSGAAVAAGLCLGSIGTDTGGSVRHPAAVCGLVGMKPTYGRVSTRGVLGLAPTLDHVGPITRSVRDNAMMLQAIAGYDAGDARSSVEDVPDFMRLIGRDIAGLRLGVPRRLVELTPHDPECLAAFDEALRVLRGLGATTEEFDFPSLAISGDLGVKLLMREAFDLHQDDLEKSPHLYERSFRERVMPAKHFTAVEMETARAARESLRRDFKTLFASGIDAIVSPGREAISDTMAQLAHPTAKRGMATRLYNSTGMPALVMPMGFGRAGMPLGIQFAANHFEEDLIYQLAAAFEAATRWTMHHPPL